MNKCVKLHIFHEEFGSKREKRTLYTGCIYNFLCYGKIYVKKIKYINLPKGGNLYIIKKLNTFVKSCKNKIEIYR